MSEQRFDIIVQDKVAKTIKTELAGIGTSAKSAYDQLRLLNGEMGRSSAGAATAAQTAATRAATATARVNAETAKGAAAQARLSTEQLKGALAAEKLATAQARTAEAQSRANIAYLREEEALNRAVMAEGRATTQKRALASATDAATAAQQRSITVHDRTVVTPGSGANFGRLVPRETTGTMNRPAPTAADTIVSPAAVATAATATRVIGQMGTAGKLSANSMANLSFQLNDVFVSLASGQKPLTVFIQQGAQIAQIPAMAGQSWKQFGAAALNSLGIVKRTGDEVLDAAAASAAALVKSVASAEAAAAANVLAADTEVELALAQQRAAVTANEQAAASARLSAANQGLALANSEATVTSNALATAQQRSATASAEANAASTKSIGAMGKGGIVAAVVIAGLAATLGALKSQANDDSGLRKFTKSMGYSASEVKKLNAVSVSWGDTAKAVFQVLAERVFSQFGVNAKSMASTWGKVLQWMASSTRMAVAGIFAAMTGLAFGVRDIIKNLGDGKANDNPFKNLVGGYKHAYDTAQKFMDDIVKKARGNARERQDAMASDMHSDKAGPKGKTASGWDRAKELKDANAELDVTIGMLGKYGDALAKAQQIEQIGRTFREHGKPLTAAETAELEKKIDIIRAGTRVQEAMTAAEEAANGPLRTFTAQQDALDNLLASGAINQQQFNEQLFLATRAFEDATDPLASLNRELFKNGELLSKYGKDRDVAAYIQSLRDAAEAQGKSIYQPTAKSESGSDDIIVNGRRKLTPEAQAMVDEYRDQQKRGQYTKTFESIDPKGKEDPTNSAYLLDHYRELYAEIDRFRQEDVANEEAAAERKKNLDTAIMDAKLETTGKMFGQLASLQNSKNRQLAAIGKAAAIAQATIDGIQAVQAALKGPPGPPWSFAIAGVTAAMTAVNVAKIAGVKGFQTGGFTGYGAPGTAAGITHGREYVMDSQATARIGIPALDALRSGGNLSQPGSAGHGGPRVSIYPQPGVYMEEVSTSDDHIEMIAIRATRQHAPKAVADDIRGGANSHTGKALGGAYGIRRTDR